MSDEAREPPFKRRRVENNEYRIEDKSVVPSLKLKGIGEKKICNSTM